MKYKIGSRVAVPSLDYSEGTIVKIIPNETNKYVIEFDEKYLRTCGYSEDEIINLYVDYDKYKILNLKDVCDYLEIITNKVNELIDLIYNIDNNK